MATKHALAEPKRKKSEAGLNISDFGKEEQSALESATPAAAGSIIGTLNQDTSDWDAPVLTLSPSDKLIRKGNAGIRLGKDQDGSRATGEGAFGSSRCAAIDIVAGNMGWLAKKKTKRGKTLAVDPDFRIDAARIYLSQKASVDDYFHLSPGAVGNTSRTDLRSCVAVKADTVRIIARENIKLVTRTDEQNSQGGKTDNLFTRGYGIDLIACNDSTDMQPLVKGENLKDCLTGIVDTITIMNNVLNVFFDYYMTFQQATISHTHMSPFFGTETAPDFKQIMAVGIQTKIQGTLNYQVPAMIDLPLEVASLKSAYLTGEGGIPGEKYILSRYNSTN